MSLTLVLGGPGCGKTTALLKIIDEQLSRGVAPHRIGYVTFTRKAAQEGLERACAKFKLEADEFPYFRTLHSLAFKQLGLQPESVMDDKAMGEFAKFSGLALSGAAGADDVGMGVSMRTEDDRILAAISLARLTRQPLEAVCEAMIVSHRRALEVEHDYRHFKDARAVVDFTDMLEHFAGEAFPVPKLQVLIVDEAQDLCRLQWEIVERLAKGVDEMFVAGDDDQAIYEWAGADVPYFLALQGKKRVLPVSYRLRREVFNVCQRLSHSIEDRFEKDWQPHGEGGLVERVGGITDLDLTEGSWYLLARNSYLLSSTRGYLRDQGFPYYWGSKSSVDNDDVRALLAWEHLRRGGTLSAPDVQRLYARLRAGKVARGYKTAEFETGEYDMRNLRESFGLVTDEDWMHVLDLSPRDREYYREIKRRGESLTKPPRITLSTIHGVKGGEADHVMLMSDMSAATYKHFLDDRAAESRVFYVGASRAKQSLHIVNPVSPKSYPIGEAV